MVKKFFLLKFFLIFLTVIKTIKSSDCLNENNENNGTLITLSLSTCTQHSYSNIILNSTYNGTNNDTNITANLDCCLLKIDSNKVITKCIEIKNDEDEIERRITAFEAMFKDATITIDCQSNFISIKLLQVFLIMFICFFIIIKIF